MTEEQDLVGSWHLESWLIDVAGRDTRGYPFGENPQGLLVYTADGWMSACICRAARDPLPDNTAFRRIDPERLAASFVSYFHYAGRYHIEGDTVVHDVSQSLNPNFPGTQQRRLVNLAGDRLVLTGTDEAGGVGRRHTLTWHREASKPVA